MNKKNQILFLVCLVFIGLFVFTNYFINESYSYGLMLKISGTKGNRTLSYYDADSGTPISIDTAIKYYGATAYMMMYQDGTVYFYRGKEITKSEYDIGYQGEQADIRARNYGEAAYRVKDTEDVKEAFDDIYGNLRIGKFYLEFSPYEYENTIDWDEVEDYYMTNYGLKDVNQNYYNYSLKGDFEPDRFGSNNKPNSISGEMEINSTNIRITSNEYKVVDDFLNKLIPLMQGDGSDYQKILAAYTYITNTTTYLTDDGFVNDLLASNTSVYDVFINRKSVCIGYSIAFSYLMDKMGIDSYIVDNITKIDQANETFTSVHTYNIVKLEGKFYKIDLTGNIFLSGISSGELSSNNLSLSSSSYNTSNKIKTYSFNYNTITSYLNASKSIKTTTTTTAKKTTTKMVTTSFKTTKGNNTTDDSGMIYIPTSNQNGQNNPQEQTTTNNSGENTTNTSSNESNNGETNTTSETNNSNGEGETTLPLEEENKNEQESSKEPFNLNIVFGFLFVLVIVLYIIYRILRGKKRNINDEDIQLILNKHISIPEQNNDNKE